MRPFFLVVEGAIGVGKTTLARLLQPRFQAGLLLEAFEENPFLSDFYADRARYAFQTQMFFLLSRYHQQQGVPERLASGPVIADYAFAKDSLFARLNLRGDEWDIYKQLYDVLSDRITSPDLCIYLRATTDVLMKRIAARDRTYEREMDRAYIESLRQAYERYFSTYTQAPLLSLDTDDLDYVRDPSALAFVEGQVRTALGVGAYQQSLPRLEPIGLGAVQETASETTKLAPGWGVVEEFLSANQAMGRLGAVLAEGGAAWSEGLRVKLRVALQDAIGGLERLARAGGVDLGEQCSMGRTR